MNSESYVDMLAENLSPEAPLITGGDYLLKQVNACCHVSCASRSWLEENSVKLLCWSARSPDFNPLENIWDILSREVYETGI